MMGTLNICVLFSILCTLFSVCIGITAAASSGVSAEVKSVSFDFVMTELMRQRDELDKLRLENVALKGQMEKELGKHAAQVEKLLDVQTSRGSNYIRWGRTTCEGNTTRLYKGYAAGAKHNLGAGANYLCLHNHPQWSRYLAGVHVYTGGIYGVEYEMYEGATNVFSYANNGGNQLVNHPAPCAMCYTPTRSTTIMIPARTECPVGWSKEYQGYIVSGYQTYQRGEYICWDEAPETATGAYNQQQAFIFPVEVICGSLPCSRFPDGLELTCVVCSK